MAGLETPATKKTQARPIERLTQKEFELGRYLTQLILFTVVGLSIGIASALVRPYANVNGMHLEAMVEFFFLLPSLSVLIMLLSLRFRYKQAVMVMAGKLTLLWLVALLGRLIIGRVMGSMLDDFIGIYLAFWIGSIACTSLLLALIRWIWPLRYAGTDCPNCGYSLKGIGTSGNCPECGQAFTARSLGVSDQSLQVEG